MSKEDLATGIGAAVGGVFGPTGVVGGAVIGWVTEQVLDTALAVCNKKLGEDKRKIEINRLIDEHKTDSLVNMNSGLKETQMSDLVGQIKKTIVPDIQKRFHVKHKWERQSLLQEARNNAVQAADATSDEAKNWIYSFVDIVVELVEQSNWDGLTPNEQFKIVHIEDHVSDEIAKLRKDLKSGIIAKHHVEPIDIKRSTTKYKAKWTEPMFLNRFNKYSDKGRTVKEITLDGLYNGTDNYLLPGVKHKNMTAFLTPKDFSDRLTVDLGHSASNELKHEKAEIYYNLLTPNV